MGSLQKTEMEVSPKINFPPYKLPEEGNVCCTKKISNLSNLSLSWDNKRKQSNGTLQGLGPSKELSIKASQAFNSEVLIKLASSDPKMDHKDPSEPFEADKSKASNQKSMTMFKDVLAQSGKGCVSYKNEKKPSLLETIREQELSLSNLTANESISLANISGRSNLLNLLNYFPQKSPIFCSKKKLLILDINGILADIVYPPPKGFKADTKIAGRAVFTRPFCSDFLKFCLERFNVAIWSSRSRRIIDRLINYLMGDMKHRLIFCWDLSHCTESKFRSLENKHKALVFKEIKKVWESYDPDLPWEKGYYNESNTLLLDDTPYKALLNPPHTAIFPYSYGFKDQGDNAIGPRGNIRAYLEELAVADNVQEYIEQHPFGQSAITERSLSWCFYNKVIQGLSAVPARV